MSKYRFRLETVKKLHVAQRDQQRAALADGYRAEQVLAERREALRAEAAGLRKMQRAALASPQTDVNQLIEVQRYEMVLKLEQQQLAEQAVRLAIEVERRRLALVEADHSVRVMEKLDERRRGEHRKRELRHEGKELDEIAGMRHRNQ